MSTYLLGIDVSTTATKALLIDDTGAVIAVAVLEYPFETPQPLWTEQDASLFWDGTVQSVRAVWWRPASTRPTSRGWASPARCMGW